MPREIEEPVRDEEGWERHPAWAMIGASRVRQSGPGAVLFDSEIRHAHYVTIRVSTASRKRDLNRDWLHPEKEFFEVAMSEAQWASFVSSMNAGSGVACTVTSRGIERVPDMPFAPRLQESMNEVRGAAEKALARVRQAFAAYKERPIKANLRSLESAIENAPANMLFAAESLTEHAEDVVQKARADIEAMVLAEATRLGIEPGDLGFQAQIGGGGDERP